MVISLTTTRTSYRYVSAGLTWRDESAFLNLAGFGSKPFPIIGVVVYACAIIRPDPLITHPALRPYPEASAAGKFR